MKRLIVLLTIILTFVSIVHATDYQWYVDSSTDGEGDVGTEAAPFDTMLQARAYIATNVGTDLTATTAHHVIHFYGTAAETAQIDWSSFTKGTSSYYIEMISENPTPGIWNTSFYRVLVSTAYAGGVSNLPAYTVMDGLQISATGTGSPGTNFSTAGVKIRNCVFKDCAGYSISVNANTCLIQNNMFYGGSEGIHTAAGKSGIVLLNNSGINLGYGVYNSATTTVASKNNYFGLTSTADYYDAGTMTQTNSYSEDETDGTTAMVPSVSEGAYFISITNNTEDLHLGSSSGLIGVGADVTGDMNPDTDIDGDARPQNTTWDVGADEYVGHSDTQIWWARRRQ